MRILLTGGCGFIGSAVIRHLIRTTDHSVVNVDKMTYAALRGRAGGRRATIGATASSRPTSPTRRAMRRSSRPTGPDAVMHLAAESHVDRSIDGPAAFIQTNVVGTFVLLDAARALLVGAATRAARRRFRFHHISTDEVFGALGPDDPPFTETTPYDPRSPYSASKAASDHLVRAW